MPGFPTIPAVPSLHQPKTSAIYRGSQLVSGNLQNPTAFLASCIFHVNKDDLCHRQPGKFLVFCRFIFRHIHLQQKQGVSPGQGSEVPFGFDFVGAWRDDAQNSWGITMKRMKIKWEDNENIYIYILGTIIWTMVGVLLGDLNHSAWSFRLSSSCATGVEVPMNCVALLPTPFGTKIFSPSEYGSFQNFPKVSWGMLWPPGYFPCFTKLQRAPINSKTRADEGGLQILWFTNLNLPFLVPCW